VYALQHRTHQKPKSSLVLSFKKELLSSLFRMRYTEINVFGVYIAPIVPMMLAAWIVMAPLRWAAVRTGLLRHVWHPALFSFSIYLVVLAAIVMLVGS
jgi:hypothetical protein